MSNKVFYKKINNQEFYNEIKKSQEDNHPTEKFMIICYSIAHKILRQARFFNTTSDWKDEACSQSLIKCCEIFNKFDLSRNSSAYSFFHTSITRSIYDTFSSDYYKYFDHKKSLMQLNACHSEEDLYYDDVNVDEDKKYFDNEENFRYKNVENTRGKV